MLAKGELAEFYKVNFFMMQNYGYSLTELEEMLPFERHIYLAMLTEWIEKENERISKNKGL